MLPMPRVAKLNNVEIRINPSEHHPAHVHVFCGDDECLLLIADGSVYAGAAAASTLAVARAYLAEHREEVTDRFFAINTHLPRR